MGGVYRRDRAVILSALAALTALAWGYLYAMGSPSADGLFCGANLGPHTRAWGLVDLLSAFLMWNVMMVGMMIPTASPMIVMFATTQKRQQPTQGSYISTAFFVLGYVLVWALYSTAASAAQFGMQSASLLTPDLKLPPWLGGGLLILAGAFQFTPLKYNCLTHCRTPLSFLLTEWREGRIGALRMGFKHGAYCVGCCWAIMLLMFVAGLMNLLWTALLAAFMLVEKVAPAGDKLGRLAGSLAIGAGTWVLWTGLPL